MYKIAVSDDNKAFLENIGRTLSQYTEKTNCDVEVQYISDSDELMELLEEKKLFDAYILDVEMPRYSGLDLVKKIRGISLIPEIVLLTSYESFAVDACGMDIFKYVLKRRWVDEAPQILEELFAALSRKTDGKIYVIDNQRRYVKFLHSDILYILKKQKNAVFVLSDGTQESERIILKQVFHRLDNPVMFFLDRTIIVNVQRIRRIENNMICMEDGFKLYVGDDKIRSLKKYITSYWGEYR